MPTPPAHRDLYTLVMTCECCGRRVRASTILRAWAARPQPSLADAEYMRTHSGGPRAIYNERGPFWDRLAAIPDREQRYKFGTALNDFFATLDRRLMDAAYVAREGARRARYG